MFKKRNLIFLSLLILGVLLLSSCFLKPPVTEGILKGQVIVPEGTVQVKDLTGQALPDATVNIIDPATGDIIATTTTDANGYYQVFVPAGGPYLLQAVKDGVKVLQITPQVEVGIEYDLGTADCSTTAVALIVQAMMDAEDFPNNPADINLSDIEADPDFNDVMSIVCSTIEAGEDPALSAVVQQAVEDFLYPPAPTPTPTPPNDAKAITAFDFKALEPDVEGVINEGAKTIALTVPYGTNVTALVPTIVHTGASVSPASGTAQNFTSSVNYTVTADDATTQVYAVTVTVAPNDAKAITAFDFKALEPDVEGVINEGAKTIALTVPYGTNVTALVPTIVHTGASVSPASGTAQNFTSPVNYTVTADDATTQVYAVTVTVAPNDAKAITAFDFKALDPDVEGVINEGAKTIALTVPYGTNVTALVPTIVHTGASVSPASGTAQNFTSSVNYTVTADDATTAVYAVTVTVAPNDAKAITAFDFKALDPDVEGVINEGAKTIALTVPYGTNVTALVPIIVHTGASVSPASGTAQNFTSPVNYTVTADDTTTQVYAVTVTVAPNDAKAITAFDFIALEPDVEGVINEGAKTIALTVPYGTNVTALVPTIVHTGASISPASGTAQNFTSPVDYTVTADDTTTQVYAVTVTVAPNDAKAITAFDFKALDPDVEGVINEGAKTIALTVPYGTNVTGLVPTIVHTGASVSPASGTAQNFTSPVDYTVTADDTTTAVYAVTVTVAPNDAKAITAFDFKALDPDVEGVINEGAKTIALTVPYGTNVTGLVPIIVHTGASVSPASGTAQNFTSPVDYTVTADDTTTAVYAVTVTVAPNDAKAITAFDFKALDPDVEGVINEGAKTIALTVPYGTNVTGLVPIIVHTGASVSPASGTAQNFTSPVDYTVTAEDTTTQVYAVTVTVAPNDAKAITAFKFVVFQSFVIGVIDEGAKTIALTVPYGTNVTGLGPIIVHTGASVSPASGTAQNFTSPVDYTVTADDATTAVYAVTVTVAPNDAKAITAFDFKALDPDVEGVINEGAKTIALAVPFGTDVTGLVPTIVHTGASVSPASGTAQNFTSPVNYTVTAEDTTTAVYAVTVIPLAIGAPYGGGIIAYIDGTGQHGLIAATEDQNTGIQWYNGSYTTTGATGTALGTGSANTTTIIASQGVTATDYAAGLARAHDGGGYSDWFLPSLDELNKLWINQGAIGGFADDYYWSSTEYDVDRARGQYFLSGGLFYGNKSGSNRVRAVRAF